MSKHTKTSLKHPEFRGRIGVARMDITHPEGIYARTWGSAKYDVAQGVHQPLLATCIVFQDLDGGTELVLVTMDAITLPAPEDLNKIRETVAARFKLEPYQFIFLPSHSHSTPFAMRQHADREGGHLIGPYVDSLPERYGDLIEEARKNVKVSILSWAYGTCGLAFNRDSIDPETDRDICGINLEKSADDTLLVGRVTDEDGKIRAVFVNYACHPVSMGGGNTLISPDYIGPMRELVESKNKDAICVFLHGASGELTPRRSYEASVDAAEQNGRELGYAALSVLNSMYPPGHQLDYQGIEESGTPLGVWHLKANADINTKIGRERVSEKLAFKPMPTRAELEASLAAAKESFEIERLERSLVRRKLIGDGAEGDFYFSVWRLGDSFLIATPSELYSQFQIEMRKKYPDMAIAVLNNADGRHMYLPVREAYERDTYQSRISLYQPGSLERVMERSVKTINQMF